LRGKNRGPRPSLGLQEIVIKVVSQPGVSGKERMCFTFSSEPQKILKHSYTRSPLNKPNQSPRPIGRGIDLIPNRKSKLNS